MSSESGLLCVNCKDGKPYKLSGSIQPMIQPSSGIITSHCNIAFPGPLFIKFMTYVYLQTSVCFTEASAWSRSMAGVCCGKVQYCYLSLINQYRTKKTKKQKSSMQHSNLVWLPLDSCFTLPIVAPSRPPVESKSVSYRIRERFQVYKQAQN